MPPPAPKKKTGLIIGIIIGIVLLIVIIIVVILLLRKKTTTTTTPTTSTTKCTSNANCLGGKICNTSSGVCVTCLADSDCTGGKLCNTSTNTCQQCLVAGDCPIVGSTCSSGTCVPPLCTAANEATICSIAPNTHCNTVTGLCGQCNVASDCTALTGANSSCTNHTCVAAQCTTDANCASHITTPRCKTSTGVCVQCNVATQATDCVASGLCNGSTNTCFCIAPATNILAAAINGYAGDGGSNCPYFGGGANVSDFPQHIQLSWSNPASSVGSIFAITIVVSRNSNMSNPFPDIPVSSTSATSAIIAVQDLGLIQKGSYGSYYLETSDQFCGVSTHFFQGETFYAQVKYIAQADGCIALSATSPAITFGCSSEPQPIFNSLTATSLSPANNARLIFNTGDIKFNNRIFTYVNKNPPPAGFGTCGSASSPYTNIYDFIRDSVWIGIIQNTEINNTDWDPKWIGGNGDSFGSQSVLLISVF